MQVWSKYDTYLAWKNKQNEYQTIWIAFSILVLVDKAQQKLFTVCECECATQF